MGKVPCEFRADRPGCSFSGEELRQGSFQFYSAQDGASSMASGYGHDLAHLLWAALLQGGLRYGPTVFRGWCPHDGAGPLWVSRGSANLHFSASGSWHDSAHLLRAGGCCTHQWTCRGPSPDQGAPPLKMTSVWHHPLLSSTARTKCAKSCQELLAEKWRLANLLETHRGPAP